MRAVLGILKRVISDKGTAITTQKFISYCESKNIELIQTTTGVRRGNIQIDNNNNWIILSVILKFSAENSQQWYKHVDKVQRAINSSVHQSTKVSPFEIHLGVKMKSSYLEENLNEIITQHFVDEFNDKRELMLKSVKNKFKKLKINIKNVW